MAPSDHKPLKSLKNETNPSQLGDPVSLKAESEDSQPTEKDMPNKAPNHTGGGGGGKGEKSLKQIAEEKNAVNPSMIGDPVSLKAETSNNEPTKDDRGALGTGNDRSKSVGNGKPKM